MAARNHSRVAHYVTTLTVVAFSMKSTNHINWRSQSTTAITLQADWSNLNYLDCGDPGCCQSTLARFVSGTDSEPTSRIHWLCVRGNHDHEWHIVRGRTEHYKFFVACGLLIVLTEPITHKPCGRVTPEQFCLLSRATDPHHAQAHSVTLLLSQIAASTCTLFSGCLLFSVCHFSHNPSPWCDQMWTLNTISPHFDDSTLLPRKLRLADTQSQLQNVPSLHNQITARTSPLDHCFSQVAMFN